MTEGPRVDVYVGPEKKHYRLPKKMLCENSSYFDQCFNGSFIEGQTQSLQLKEDKVELFEIILKLMYTGKVEEDEIEHDTFVTYTESFRQCIAFIEYLDKYDLTLGCVAAIEKSIEHGLRALVRHKDLEEVLRGDDIALIFRVAPPGSPVRGSIAQAVLTFGNTKPWEKQEQDVPGYAAEILAQLRSGNNIGKWRSSFEPSEKTRVWR